MATTAYDKTFGDALEVDESISKEFGNDYATSIFSDTTSVSSSIKDYTYENGRRYHAYKVGKYLLPNDEDEQGRMDVMHHFWMLMKRGRLNYAPLTPSSVKKILDVGTGTGIWAMEAGDVFSNAEVIGVDLSPIQPQWVPPNVKFQVDDLEEPWTFPENDFSYIHIRTMAGSIHDWKRLFEQSFTHLEPGGFIEVTEYDIRDQFCDDGTLKPDSFTKTYYKLLNKAMGIVGTVSQPDTFEKMLKGVGFENVTVNRAKVPTKPWTKDARLKELGHCMLELSAGYESYGLAAFTRVLKMDEGEARKIIDGAVKEQHNLSLHAYMHTYIIYAKKPE